MSSGRLTRRELIASGAAAGALTAVPPAWARSLLSREPRVGPGPFLDGVASGEPSRSAITFWSRLNTDRPRSGARLVVATDEGMRRVVASRIVPTGRGIRGALKARLGRLEPDTEYFYVWESGTDISELGRARTAPARDSGETVRLAFSSCQQYPAGFFGAHADAAALPDLDLYLFLGDYIYERDRDDVRSDRINAVDLRSYFRKYRLYRSDPDLRELHRVHPAVHVWDDHELENNYSDNNPAPTAAQRAAAYRSAFEWLPRLGAASERHRIYKKLSYGSVADVFMLDERQYRTGDLDGQPRKILGDGQMDWLIRGLRASRATWKVIAQQMVVASLPDERGRTNADAWDGYPEDRARLLGEIERAGIDNVVFLSGDAHVFMANLLASDFRSLGDGSTRKPAAVEYVGGSVTSPGSDEPEPEVRRRAPWVGLFDGVRHGYAYMELSHEQLVVEYRASDHLVPGGGTASFARLVQPVGTNRFSR